jgi:ubiquinone/menaquinone biosynthesis C-methylase UbiE
VMASKNPEFFEGTEMPTSGWWAALWPDPAAVLAATMLTPGMKAVDLCCGDGWFTLPIARVAQHVVALDIDRPLLDAARRRLREGDALNCEFKEGNAYGLATLVGSPADFVFMANAFHGVPDRRRLSGAVEAALKPGGLFAVVNWHQRPREETTLLGEPRGPKTELRLSPEQTQNAVEQSGLRLVKQLEIPPYHYGAVFQRPQP